MADLVLYVGEAMHARFRPVRRRFAYRLFSLLVDIDALPRLGVRTLSHNRFNLLSLYDRDHGPRDGSPLRPWIEKLLAERGVALGGGRILLHCMPRVLGYVFDPLSVYFCRAADGRLAAIVYEVKNTFGEQHAYVLPVAAERAAGAPIRQRCAKTFYVSPLLGMDAEYEVRLREPGDRYSLAIRLRDREGDIMIATYVAQSRRPSDANLLRCFFALPLQPAKVVFAIHWQALRLWLKGAKFHRHPDADKRPAAAAP